MKYLRAAEKLIRKGITPGYIANHLQAHHNRQWNQLVAQSRKEIEADAVIQRRREIQQFYKTNQLTLF